MISSTIKKERCPVNQNPRRKYSQEFKDDAVKLVKEQGYRLSEAARNLDLDPSVLRRWINGSAEDKSAVITGKGRMTPEQEEIRRLREENKRLLIEREILKKAAAFFANESK
jgi:transposase